MEDKPILLKAVELIIADPKVIQKEVLELKKQYLHKHPKKNPDDIQNLLAKKLISNYSYLTAFSGAATSLTSIIPGLGQIVTVFGGATADAALCMKYQIELTMAIATTYDRDITIEEEKRLCFLIAGLGTTNQFAKEGGKKLTADAFIRLVKEHLKGATLALIKELFKKIGLIFTRKALEKAIPFGVGVIISATANKTLTWYVGNKALDFFIAEKSS